MKRMLVVIMASLLIIPGCVKKQNEDPSEVFYEREFASAAPAGEIPSALSAIIEGNIFGARKDDGTFYSNDRLFPGAHAVVFVGESADETVIRLYDDKGVLLAERAEPFDTRRSVFFACPTEDGGFIYVLGFVDFQLEDGSWSSDKGVYSKVVKCSPDGSPEWEREFPKLSYLAFQRMIEREGAYYFFGEYSDAPRNSYDHVMMLKLGSDGIELKRNTIAGEDFDYVRKVEPTEDGFLLHIDSQSRSGDFFPIKGESDEPYGHCGRYFKAQVDLELEKRGLELGDTDYCGAEILPVGTLSGRDVYDGDIGFKYPGYVTLALECGEYILIVSENNTGVYEHTPPFVSAIWHYTETVYSVFDRAGELVCRRAFDSSPDYDAISNGLNAKTRG